jgi:hypothetical protein
MVYEIVISREFLLMILKAGMEISVIGAVGMCGLLAYFIIKRSGWSTKEDILFNIVLLIFLSLVSIIAIFFVLTLYGTVRITLIN